MKLSQFFHLLSMTVVTVMTLVPSQTVAQAPFNFCGCVCKATYSGQNHMNVNVAARCRKEVSNKLQKSITDYECETIMANPQLGCHLMSNTIEEMINNGTIKPQEPVKVHGIKFGTCTFKGCERPPITRSSGGKRKGKGKGKGKGKRKGKGKGKR